MKAPRRLGLAEGAAAFALIKASWVVLLVDDESGAPLKLSARNQLRGTVQSVKRGAVNAEVSLALEGGAVITAVVTNESVDTLGLAEGETRGRGVQGVERDSRRERLKRDRREQAVSDARFDVSSEPHADAHQGTLRAYPANG